MQIGNKSYPTYRLYPILHDAVKKLYGRFASEEIDYETVGALLGRGWSHTSSTFRNKISSMKAYRLIEGRGKIRVTETGRKLTHGNQTEQNEATVEAITAIDLWKPLFDKYTEKGQEPPTDDFWVELREITGVPPDEAKKHAKQARKAYLDDVQYLKLEKEPQEGEYDMGVGGGIDVTGAISEGVLGRVIVKDAGFIDVKDKTTYEIAKAYLKLFAEKLGVEEMSGEGG